MLGKLAVYKVVQEEILSKSNTIQNAFDDLNSAVSDDSKSTAGDKHETGRAMVHLEQEKLSKQLLQLNQLKETLAKIIPEENHSSIQFGSLVNTSKGLFFFSIGLGKINFNKTTVFWILFNPLTLT